MQPRRPAPTDAAGEITVDLTTQDLLDASTPASGAESGMIEVNDISEVDPCLRADSFAATSIAITDGDDDSVEIELTPDQMRSLHDDSQR